MTRLSPDHKVSTDWAEFVPELMPTPADIVITKRQGSFFMEELDLQLRRREIDTIVLCGIATDYRGEITARFATSTAPADLC